MARRSKNPTRRKNGLGSGLSARANAVLRAFRDAKYSAPGYVISCGVFPEISESATDRLHSIVHDLADRRLGKRKQMKALHAMLRSLAARGRDVGRRTEELDRIEAQLTALLASEATAAYLFGLSVGLAIRELPDRLDA
jgi:hypothetical protein